MKSNPSDFLGSALENELKATQKQMWRPVFTNPPRVAKFAHFWNFSTTPLHSAHVPGGKNKNPWMETYVKNFQPFITAQPSERQDVVPSILEFNFSAFTDSQEREQEWNTLGLESGLNPQVFVERYIHQHSIFVFISYVNELE
jgi:hypothetical protein